MADRPGPKNTSPEEMSWDPTLQDILLAITASQVVLEGKIDALATDLMVRRDDYRRLAEKVATTDRQLKELLPEVKDTTTTARQMEKQIRDLELRAEDAENRSQRNNIGVIAVYKCLMLPHDGVTAELEILEKCETFTDS
ncbi:hypothetical protein NDU88_000503 [Pleurodeles waltl]|uniref:Uncharacterized protein n=1 Tax=Pleurodeles waltl TaxID=8319 RepID=A0AAV7P452_PLEWA|nr:hypothetical protein NDU88_000503 [Pleurodeles waltl]